MNRQSTAKKERLIIMCCVGCRRALFLVFLFFLIADHWQLFPASSSSSFFLVFFPFSFCPIEKTGEVSGRRARETLGFGGCGRQSRHGTWKSGRSKPNEGLNLRLIDGSLLILLTAKRIKQELEQHRKEASSQ